MGASARRVRFIGVTNGFGKLSSRVRQCSSQSLQISVTGLRVVITCVADLHLLLRGLSRHKVWSKLLISILFII